MAELSWGEAEGAAEGQMRPGTLGPPLTLKPCRVPNKTTPASQPEYMSSEGVAFAPTARVTDNHRPSTGAPVSSTVTLNGGSESSFPDLPVRVLCHSGGASWPPGPVTGQDPQAHSSPSPTHSLPDNGPASATPQCVCVRSAAHSANSHRPRAQATMLRGDNAPSQWALNAATEHPSCSNAARHPQVQ